MLLTGVWEDYLILPVWLRERRSPVETEPVPGKNPSESERRPTSSEQPNLTPDSVAPPDRQGSSSVETDVPASGASDIPAFIE